MTFVEGVPPSKHFRCIPQRHVLRSPITQPNIPGEQVAYRQFYGGPEVHSRFPFLVSTFALICASRFPFVLICASRFPFVLICASRFPILIPPSFVPRISRSSSFVLRVSHFSFRPHLCLAFPNSHSALIRAPNFSPPRPRGGATLNL